MRWLSGVFMLPMLLACAATDPALQQGIADVSARPERARVALRPFAEQGNEAAITHICIAHGRSMDSQVRSPEREQAFAWCEHAANAGNVEAQYHLGNFYAWGVGTAENRALALRWYTEAAGHGHARAEDAKRGLEGKSAICRNPITNCKLF
jgi:TPR repeat protein